MEATTIQAFLAFLPPDSLKFCYFQLKNGKKPAIGLRLNLWTLLIESSVIEDGHDHFYRV